MLPGGASAGHLVHDGRTGHGRCADDADRPMARERGVFNLEQLDPRPFLAALGRHGLPWHVKEWNSRIPRRGPRGHTLLGGGPRPVARQSGAARARPARRTGSKILLALKGFRGLVHLPPGATVSGRRGRELPDEARLGREEFGREVHAYAPAYSEADLGEIPAVTPTTWSSIPLGSTGAFASWYGSGLPGSNAG